MDSNFLESLKTRNLNFLDSENSRVFERSISEPEIKALENFVKIDFSNFNDFKEFFEHCGDLYLKGLFTFIKTLILPFSEEEFKSEDPKQAFKKERELYLPTKKTMESVPVYDGAKLSHGNRINGPALIEQVNTTTFLTDEYAMVCDKFGSYTLYLKSRESEFIDRVLKGGD